MSVKWIAMPTVSPQKASFSLEDQGQTFVPDHAPGMVQRNVTGNRRWRIHMEWQNLSQDEQAQFKAFLASVQGRSRSFMVEVGRMVPWRGSMDAFNRFDDATAQCNVSSGKEVNNPGIMTPMIDQGRLRFQKVGGYGNYQYAPTSYSSTITITSLDLFGTYAWRQDVVAQPTIQSSTHFQPIIVSDATSYMALSLAYRGNSGTQTNTRAIAPFVATNTTIAAVDQWGLQGMPGDNWWLDNLYLGRVGLVDNGQNLLPFTATYSGVTTSQASLEASFNAGGGAQWLDGVQTAATLRGTVTVGNHFMEFPCNSNFKANSWGLAINAQPMCTLQGMIRNGINTGSGQHFAISMQDLTGGGGNAARTVFDTTSQGDGERAPTAIGGNFIYGRAWQSHVGGFPVSNWMKAAIQAKVDSESGMRCIYFFADSAQAFSFAADSMTMLFGNLALHANVWSYGAGICVPDLYYDVPGRFVPTSTLIMSGNPQTGAELYLKGLPTSMAQAARAGDFLTLHNGELKKLTTDLNTDGFGCGVAHFEPSIVTPPAHLNPVFFGPGAYMRAILSKPPQWDLKPGFFADLTVDVEEVWEP